MADADPGGRPARRIASLAGVAIALRAVRAALRSPRALPPAAVESEQDPSEREVPSSRRAETLVAALLLAAAVCGFGFTAAYVVEGTNPQLLGIAIGGALALLSAACIVA